MEELETVPEETKEKSLIDTESIERVTTTVLERPPTMRQRMAVDEIVANGGNVSEAMRRAGYSIATARTPQKLTESKSFQALLEKRLPERHLLKKHREFLDSKKIIRVYVKGDLKEITEETDSNAVKALDMAYKLKGKYQEKSGNSVLVINVSAQSSDRYKPVVVPVDESKLDETTQVSSSE